MSRAKFLETVYEDSDWVCTSAPIAPTHMHSHIHTCIHIPTYIYTYIHTHSHTHTQTPTTMYTKRAHKHVLTHANSRDRRPSKQSWWRALTPSER